MADKDPSFPRKIAAGLYFFLILLGIAFYVGWSLAYNTWDLTKPENTGVYAITVLLLGFGITGYFLYRTAPRKAPETEKGQ